MLLPSIVTEPTSFLTLPLFSPSAMPPSSPPSSSSPSVSRSVAVPPISVLCVATGAVGAFPSVWPLSFGISVVPLRLFVDFAFDGGGCCVFQAVVLLGGFQIWFACDCVTSGVLGFGLYFLGNSGFSFALLCGSPFRYTVVAAFACGGGGCCGCCWEAGAFLWAD